MNDKGRLGWVWMLACILALALPVGSLAQSASHTLRFDRECLDLDTGTQADCGSEAAAGWDVAVVENALRPVRSVLFHNGETGVQVAFLVGADFASVSVDDVAVAAFQDANLDLPMDGTGVYLVRTDLGAVFKIGLPSETDAGASLTFELLEGGVQ